MDLILSLFFYFLLLFHVLMPLTSLKNSKLGITQGKFGLYVEELQDFF